LRGFKNFGENHVFGHNGLKNNFFLHLFCASAKFIFDFASFLLKALFDLGNFKNRIILRIFFLRNVPKFFGQAYLRLKTTFWSDSKAYD
jgi:hypothetical protein